MLPQTTKRSRQRGTAANHNRGRHAPHQLELQLAIGFDNPSSETERQAEEDASSHAAASEKTQNALDQAEE